MTLIRAPRTSENTASISRRLRRFGLIPALLEIPARVSDELRWVVIGKMHEKHWSAVITRRSENVRIISVRRSRDEEIEIYESQDI
jgi:uncharacterized DUF497 family protein